MEQIAFGFGLAEAPRPDGRGGLYFSDVLLGGVHHWWPDGTVEVVVPKRQIGRAHV